MGQSTTLSLEEEKVAAQISKSELQILVGATKPDEIQRKAKLSAQPMSSNFDGNCGG